MTDVVDDHTWNIFVECLEVELCKPQKGHNLPSTDHSFTLLVQLKLWPMEAPAGFPGRINLKIDQIKPSNESRFKHTNPNGDKGKGLSTKDKVNLH